MRRTILHSLIAVILGVTVPLASAAALIQLNARSEYTAPVLTTSLLELKQSGNNTNDHSYNYTNGHSYQTSRSTSNEVEGFAVSFIIAMLIYLLFKRKTPRRTYIWVRNY